MIYDTIISCLGSKPYKLLSNYYNNEKVMKNNQYNKGIEKTKKNFRLVGKLLHYTRSFLTMYE